MPAAKIGQILVGRRLLEPEQVSALIQLQATDPRPLGQIASEQFGIERDSVYEALAEQIIAECPRINMTCEAIDPNCLQLVRAEEAWGALVMPMRVEEGVLICATTAETLDRAIRTLHQRTAMPYRFCIVAIRQLEQYICQLYDYEGLDISDVA